MARRIASGARTTVMAVLARCTSRAAAVTAAAALVPGKQNVPIWLTQLIGVVAAIPGTLVAGTALSVDDTAGIDWIELLIQVVFAAMGIHRRRRLRPPSLSPTPAGPLWTGSGPAG